RFAISRRPGNLRTPLRTAGFRAISCCISSTDRRAVPERGRPNIAEHGDRPRCSVTWRSVHQERKAPGLLCALCVSTTPPVFVESGHDLDEIARLVPRVQLPFEDMVPAVLHRAGRTGQGKKVSATSDTRTGPGLNR